MLLDSNRIALYCSLVLLKAKALVALFMGVHDKPFPQSLSTCALILLNCKIDSFLLGKDQDKFDLLIFDYVASKKKLFYFLTGSCFH